MADPTWQKNVQERTQAMLVDGSQLPTGQRAQRQRRGPAAAAGAGLVAAAATRLAAAAAAPRGTRPGRGKEGIASTSRLEQQVVSSRLWEPACQALQPPLPAAVPATFGSLQQYVAAFEPLMLEEAAEGIKAAFEESERAGRGADVEVQIVSSLSSEWHNVRLAAATPEALAALRQLQQDRDCSVVVLSLYISADAAAAAADEEQRATSPPGSRQQQQQQQRGVLAARVTGLVRWWELEQGAVYVHVRPCCGKHPAEASSPCCKVLQQMQQWMDHPLGSWRLTPAGSIVTSVREFRTLERLRAVHPPLLDFILNPSKQQSDNNSTRASRSSASTEANQQQPHSAAAAAAKELPSEVGSSAFRSYLTEHFDGPQIHAITCAAAHLVQQQQQQQRGSTPEQQDELDEDQQMHDQQEVNSTAAAAAGQPYVPFTLIQGPPGTGKTHTVLGVLNAWHLTQFQRFFLSLDAAVRELAERGAKLDAEMTSDGFSGRLAPRPRILVCAPSNAAIDELLERILRGTFRDVNGRVYRPDVVRLGSEEALSEEARQVWVEQLCGRLLAHSVASYTAERQEQEHQFQLCLRRMHNLTESLQVMQSMLVKERAAAAAPDGADAAAAAATHEQQVLGLVAQLVNEFEQLQKIKQALARLAVLEHLVAGPGSNEWGKRLAALQAAQQQKQQQHAAHQPGQPPHFSQAEFWRAAFRAAPREVQSDLEMSFVEKAEMVFTTLSSSARDVFSRLGTPFELVLVDEAAQAAEIAALQPLVYGAKAVVMVGDPQQLPATLFSQAAKQLALERSLFERLAEAGCPVNVLTVQYRMHPAIRTFPSAYFYHSQLIDAPSVLQRPRPWFDAAAAAAAAAAGGNSATPAATASSSSSVLLPYVVYDVSRGRERFAARGGKSPENELEARMAVALYGEVRRVRAAALAAAAASVAREPPQLRLDVGVITPYRGQRTLLRRLFEQRFGKAVLQEVKIETVDSFQGKQLDIVILSCVRAPKGGAAGPAAAAAAAAADWPESTGSTTADRPAQQAVQKALQRAEQAASADAAAASEDQQQQEPITLQLVRKGGVGFLSDTRRMNVAITRARQALYVLGHCDTLVSNPAWAALIGDAGARGCLVWDAQPDDVADQQRRAALAGKLHKARQLQEAMMPHWQQQQQAADGADAAAAAGDGDGGDREGGAADRMLVDASTAAAATNPSDQQQQGRTSTPPLGAAAGGTPDDGSRGKDWLQAMRENQAAELKRKSEGQQQQQPKNKRQRLLAEEQREGSDAGGSAPGTPQLPGTPQHAAAAAAGEGAAAAAGQQSPVQHPQQAAEQQLQQLQLDQQQQQQQQQQQVAEDEVWWGAPGDGFDTYRGMTPKQGAVLWLLSPLVQQSMLQILLAMSPQEVAGALQRMSPADVAWVLPALQQQQQQQQGAAAAGFVPGQQQQQGGQLALPGHGLLPPGGATPGAIIGPGQQQQQQQQHLLGPPPQQGGYAPAAAAGAGYAGHPQQPQPPQLLMQQQQQPGVPGMRQQGVLMHQPGIQMMVLQAQHAAAAAGLGGPPMQQFVMGPDGTVLQQQQQMFGAAQGQQQQQQQDPGQQQQQGGQQGWKGKQQKHQGGQSPVGGRGQQQQQQHGGRGGGRGGRGGGRQQQQGKGGGRGGRGGDGQQQQGRGGGRGGGRGQQQQQHRQGGGGGRGRGRVVTADNK